MYKDADGFHQHLFFECTKSTKTKVYFAYLQQKSQFPIDNMLKKVQYLNIKGLASKHKQLNEVFTKFYHPSQKKAMTGSENNILQK